MGFLDSRGLSYFHGKMRAALAGKQDQLAPDATIRLEGTEIGVALPTKALTQAEYDALPEEEKRNGTLYMTPGVPSDGVDAPVPTGAVISFLALSAPSGYLICDGAEYPVTMYPGLARYIQEQFGSSNHFGGDGETTFAVPDMRNLFLRGYHGEAEEQLSGEMGERQEATEHLHFAGASNGAIMQIRPGDVEVHQKYADKNVEQNQNYGYVYTQQAIWRAEDTVCTYYTSRPVNMTVLYCIKA